MEINNKTDRGTFMLTHNSLTLKEWTKVKSDIARRFASHGSLKVECALQTFRTNDKRDRGTFMEVQTRVAATVPMETQP